MQRMRKSLFYSIGFLAFIRPKTKQRNATPLKNSILLCISLSLYAAYCMECSSIYFNRQQRRFVHSPEQQKIHMGQGISGVDSALLVAQTTLPHRIWDGIVRVLRGRVPRLEVRDTICAATAARQEEAEKLARRADVVLVVGTAGQVMPACSLPLLAKQHGAKIIEVNTQPSAYTDGVSDFFFRQKATEFFAELEKHL